ncbi:MAG: heparinase II/III family protein [Caldilineaceae bacterium]|nr:heparinase II/III family protein [Caldilineaceae bacterium]
MKARADEWAARPSITVPETGGGFYHAADKTKHLITLQHYALADGARDMALTFHLTGDAGYLPNAKAILLAYADAYLTYEIHDKAERTGDQAESGGRTTPQGINEGMWIVPLVWAYDLLYNEFTPDERAAIENRILRPAAELVMDNNEGPHNHQTWYNGTVGLLGFALGDADLIAYALDKSDSGHRFQMGASVTGDGMWYEGSMHYQLFVLRALLPFMEAARHACIDLYAHPAYKRLFDFLIDYADENWRLPTINDGQVVQLTEPDRLTYFELAYRRFGDARYASLLRHSPRTDLNALVFGVGELPHVPRPALHSRYFADSDLVVLRAGAGEGAVQAVFNLMAYVGGHSHPDQLGLILHGLGRELAPDAGSIKYRIPAHVGYFKQTVAHNVVVVDGQSQAHRPPADLVAFAGTEAVQVAQAVSTGAYPGVEMVRTLLLTAGYLVDITDVASEVEHDYDWVCHNRGAVTSGDFDFRPTAQSIGDTNGYEYLENVRMAHNTRSSQVRDLARLRGQILDGPAGSRTRLEREVGDMVQIGWEIDPRRHVRATVLNEPGTDYFLADGPIAAAQGDLIDDEAVPVLIARRRAATTRYVSIVEAYRDAPGLSRIVPVALDRGEGMGLRLERAGGHDLLVLDESGGEKQIGDLRFDGHLLWASFEGDDLRSVYVTGGGEVGTSAWTLTLSAVGAVVMELGGEDGVRMTNAGANEIQARLSGRLGGQTKSWSLAPDRSAAQAVRSFPKTD